MILETQRTVEMGSSLPFKVYAFMQNMSSWQIFDIYCKRKDQSSLLNVHGLFSCVLSLIQLNQCNSFFLSLNPLKGIFRQKNFFIYYFVRFDVAHSRFHSSLTLVFAWCISCWYGTEVCDSLSDGVNASLAFESAISFPTMPWWEGIQGYCYIFIRCKI